MNRNDMTEHGANNTNKSEEQRNTSGQAGRKDQDRAEGKKARASEERTGGRSENAESAEARLAKARDVAMNLGGQLEVQIKKHPYALVGGAAAVGFMVGSIFGSRLGQFAVALAGGYVLKNVLGNEEAHWGRMQPERTDANA